MGLMAGLKEGARFSPYTQYESRVDCLGTFVQIRYVTNSTNNRLQACVTIWIIFTLKINSIKFVVFIPRLYKMYINKFRCLHLTRLGVNDHKVSSSSIMRRLHPFSQYYKSIELRRLHYTTTSRGTSQS